ncbi:MAG TPA: thioredoxin family protein [Gaiellaceae bacterium]|nr:thioredoxin family protein [Gaiellaceae bacterium]
MGIPEQTHVRQIANRGRNVQVRPPRRRLTISTAVLNAQKPGLVFFYSPVSGSCRRVEGFLAQVLQRRRNHGTFKLYRVDEKERPDLVERFAVGTMPTLVVVEGKAVRARLERPRGCREIESFLAPWLK